MSCIRFGFALILLMNSLVNSKHSGEPHLHLVRLQPWALMEENKDETFMNTLVEVLWALWVFVLTPLDLQCSGYGVKGGRMGKGLAPWSVLCHTLQDPNLMGLEEGSKIPASWGRCRAEYLRAEVMIYFLARHVACSNRLPLGKTIGAVMWKPSLALIQADLYGLTYWFRP